MAKFKGLFVAKPIETVSATYPDLVAEVKTNLNIDADDTTRAAELARLIAAATEVAENYTGRIIAQKQLKYYAYNYSGDGLVLPVSPWTETISVKGGTAGNLQNITGINTLPKTLGVYFDFENSISVDELEIIINAGYPDNLPKPIQQAIIIIASDMFDTDRSNYIYNVSDNQTAKKLLTPYILTRY